MTEGRRSGLRRRWPALAAVALLLGLAVAWLVGWERGGAPGQPSVPRPPAPPARLAAGPATPAPVQSEASGVTVSAQAASAAPPASPSPTLEPAHWHLADTRASGDDRSPPLVRPPQPPFAASWQLDSPSAYLAREVQEHRAVQQAFVEAADRELPALRQLLDRAREQGLSPQAIAKGEEKLRRIAEQREAMRAALASAPPP